MPTPPGNKRFRVNLHPRQNGLDHDGWLSWARPVRTYRSTGVGLVASCGPVPVVAPLALAPCGVPVEVGTSKPSVTYLHLERCGGVARGAYGDDVLALS
ncbi:hypothetical protein [Streptomyces sp. 3214.6]|uniref:hypothetical protein n=1 Tax=Streptomyces sp. 3214.6 TaxID=1882757 RepID=UPI001396785D|nr:hypothetical protein [Streptomyces sp. 3214.6]